MVSEESFIINLGVFIRQIRERKNLSQQSLADISDLPKTTIGRIERAEINTTIRTLVKIANALEIEPKELLNFQIKQLLCCSFILLFPNKFDCKYRPYLRHFMNISSNVDGLKSIPTIYAEPTALLGA
jgi:transcriptional regulator with XRE-family HTH domain